MFEIMYAIIPLHTGERAHTNVPSPLVQNEDTHTPNITHLHTESPTWLQKKLDASKKNSVLQKNCFDASQKAVSMFQNKLFRCSKKKGTMAGNLSTQAPST